MRSIVTMRLSLLLLAVLVAVVNAASIHKREVLNGHKRIIYCYFEAWAVYDPGHGKYDVEDIDTSLCTHVTYGFAGLGGNHKIKSLDPWHDLEENYGEGAYKRFTKLCKDNGVIPLLSIGGWNEGSTKYSAMASTAAFRKTFVDSVVAFLARFGFEGLDLDWEYPACRGGKPEDKQNHALLMQETRAAFESHNYLLTAALSAGYDKIDVAYDVPSISKSLHIMNVMTYDFHGEWDKYTHHNTPMGVHPLDVGNTTKYNVRYAIEYWLELGADASKITLGMAPYGRTFTLDNPKEEKGLYAPASQPGTKGPYSGEAGYLNYNEICKSQNSHAWEITNDKDLGAPYGFYQNNQWCSYDDPVSIVQKTNLIKEKNLGGGMIWAIDTDDFTGDCGQGKYPISTVIVKELDGGPPLSTTTVDPTATTTPAPPTTSTTPGPPTTTTTAGPTTEPPPEPDCTGDTEYYPAPLCTEYWWCFGGKAHLQHCNGGLVWDTSLNSCNYVENTDISKCKMPEFWCPQCLL